MRRIYLFVFLLSVLFLTPPANSNGQGRAMIPGLREGEKQMNAPLDPPAFQAHRTIDGPALSQEAAELARLSSIVPGQIEELRAGKFHKDLTDELKRIEKLAKHLRTEVSP